MKVRILPVIAVGCGVFSVNCSGGGGQSTGASSQVYTVYAPGTRGGVQAQHVAPNIRYRTDPATSPGSPYPVISGIAPLKIVFNLCPSDDPDPGDSLNWQFHFGDDRSEPFRSDGTFNPN